jgi:hypothetical protein
MMLIAHRLRAVTLRPLQPPPPGLLVQLALVCTACRGGHE